MKTKIFNYIALTIAVALCHHAVLGQMTDQERQTLLQFSQLKSAEYDSIRSATLQKALAENYTLEYKDINGDPIYLSYFNAEGNPVYVAFRNATSQQTISVDEVKTGGSAGYTLNGTGELLGIWDGTVRTTHQEFGGRASYGDSPGTPNNHGTHVAGTIAAGGVQPGAQGMSDNVNLVCYTAGNDISEMAAAAAASTPIIASNHSYGPDPGWFFSVPNGLWVWGPNPSTPEDWQFGAYIQNAVNYDQTAANAPFYLIVVAAGNDNGNGTTGMHLHVGQGTTQFNDTHIVDGGPTGVDCLPGDASAKNVLTIGNCLAIPVGYMIPSDVVLAGSSSRGPCDDGRIKPDLVAQGIGVFSSTAASDTDYGIMTGTSMAAPAVTGSIGLLAQHWKNLYSPTSVLRASVMKALLIHTADEAGANPGPDNQFGWGLVNVRKAAQLMEANAVNGCVHILQSSLSSPGTYSITVQSNGLEPLKATIVWTDPAGSLASGTIDDPAPSLVNDLDLRIASGATTFFPWRLNVANPLAGATKANNAVDNVEQVLIDNPAAGSYTITVTPNGPFSGGSQIFGLIISGNGPNSYNHTISSGVFATEKTYSARNNIDANGTAQVVTGGRLNLYAGNSILLGPDFRASGGGELDAKIVVDPCFVEAFMPPADDENSATSLNANEESTKPDDVKNGKPVLAQPEYEEKDKHEVLKPDKRTVNKKRTGSGDR